MTIREQLRDMANSSGHEETPWKVYKITDVLCAECEQKRLNQNP